MVSFFEHLLANQWSAPSKFYWDSRPPNHEQHPQTRRHSPLSGARLPVSGFFRSNSLGGSLPTQLGKLTKMTELFLLQENGFTSSIPTQFGDLVEMNSELNLASNALSLAIPTQLGMLTKITAGFRFESNMFCDDIPTEGQVIEYACARANFLPPSRPRAP